MGNLCRRVVGEMLADIIITHQGDLLLHQGNNFIIVFVSCRSEWGGSNHFRLPKRLFARVSFFVSSLVVLFLPYLGPRRFNSFFLPFKSFFTS